MDGQDPLGNPIVQAEAAQADPVASKQDTPASASSSGFNPLGDPIIPAKPTLSDNYKQVMNTDPDKNSQVHNLHLQTGDPKPFIANNLDAVKKATTQTPPPDDVHETHPKTAEWWENPDNLAMTHDDVPAMQKHESVWDDFYKGFAGTSKMWNSFFGLEYNIGTKAAGLFVPKVFGIDEAYDSAVQKLNVFNDNRKFWDNEIKGLVTPEADKDTLDAIANKDWNSLGRKLITQLPNVPALVGGVGALGPLAMAPVLGTQTGAESYDESKEKGISEGKAVASATFKGAVSGATMLIPMGYLSKLFTPLAGQVGREGAIATIKAATAHWLESTGAMAGQNVIQTMANSVADYVSGEDPKALENIGHKLASSAIEGGILGAALSTAPAIGQALGREKLPSETPARPTEPTPEQVTQQASMTKESFLKLLDAAKNTKLLERSPEAYKELADKMQPEGGVNAHIPIEEFKKFYQGENMDPEEQAKKWGQKAHQSYLDALEHGGNVTGPLSELLASKGSSGELEKLADNIKFSPQDHTVNEAKEYKDQQAKREEENKAEIDREKQLKAYEKGLAEQIKDVGGKPTMAKVVTQFMRNLSEKTGIPVDKLIDSYEIRFNRTPAPEELATTMFQSSKSSLTLDAEKQKAIFGDSSENWKPDALTGIEAATKGENGKVYTGHNHGEAISAGAKEGQSFGKREQFGFKLPDGSFVTRAEAKEKYGFSTSEELHALRGEKSRDMVYFQGNRGEIRMAGVPGKRTFDIYIHEGGDASTFFHEPAHAFLEIFKDIASKEGAPKELIEDQKKLFDWLNIKDWSELTENHHEQFARGFEYRLWEGKVPVAGLRRVFDRFTEWMRQVYPNFEAMQKYLGVTLTDEMRGVYDRMIATKDEIDLAHEKMGYNKEAPKGATEDEIKAWTKAQEKAKSSLFDKVMRGKMGDLSPVENELREQEMEKAKVRAKEEIESMPVYQAQDYISERAGDDVREVAKRVLAGTATPEEERALSEAGMLHLDTDDPQAVAKIMESANREDQMANLVMEHMAPFEPTVNYDPDLLTVGMHEGETGEKYSDMLTEEAAQLKAQQQMQKAMERQFGKEFQKELKSNLEAMPEVQQLRKEALRASRMQADFDRENAKSRARTILDGVSFKDAQDYRTYMTVERNMAQKAALAESKGDLAKAYDYKQKQLLNHALATEAIKNRNVVRKAVQDIKWYSKFEKDSSPLTYGHWQVMKDLLEGYKFKRATPNNEPIQKQRAEWLAEKGTDPDSIADQTGMVHGPDGWHRESFTDFADRMKEKDANVAARLDLDLSKVNNLDDVKFRDLKSLKNTLGVLYENGRKNVELDIAGKKENLDAFAKDTLGQIKDSVGLDYGRNPRTLTDTQKRIDTVSQIVKNGPLNLPQNLSEVTGMGKMVSNLTKGYDIPLNNAKTEWLKTKREMKEAFDEVMDKHYTPKELQDFKKTVPIKLSNDPKPQNFNKWEILNTLRLMGSETGLDRLKRGNGFTDQDLRTIIDHLDERDIKFAKDWAKMDEKNFARIVDTEQRVHNYEPKALEKKPIMTKFGVIEGMYHPLKYDYDHPNMAGRDKPIEVDEKFKPLNPYLDKSMTKERVKNLPYPVRLDEDVYINHLESVAKYLAYEEHLNGINKFLNHPDVDAGIKAGFGEQEGGGKWLYKNHLDFVIHGDKTNLIDKGFKATRIANIMFHIASRPFLFPVKLLSDMNSVTQEPGLGPVKALTYMVKAAPFGDFGKIHSEVTSKSEIMRSRALSAINYDMYSVNEVFKMATPSERAQKMMQMLYFWPERLADRVSFSAWKDIYDTHKMAGVDHETARALADDRVAKLFGSAEDIYRSFPQRGPELLQQVSPAWTFFGAQLNRAITTGRIKYLMTPEEIRNNPVKDTMLRGAIISRQVLMYATIPAIVEELGRRYLYHRKDDRKEGLAEDLTHKAETSPFKLIPGGARIASSFEYPKLQDKIMSSIPSLEFVNDMMNSAVASKNLLEGKALTDKEVHDALGGPMEAMGLPERLDALVVNLHRDLIEHHFSWYDIFGPVKSSKKGQR